MASSNETGEVPIEWDPSRERWITQRGEDTVEWLPNKPRDIAPVIPETSEEEESIEMSGFTDRQKEKLATMIAMAFAHH